MRLAFFALLFAGFLGMMGACKSSSSKETLFCDTVCLKDTLKFTGNHKLRPYVYISTNNCHADTILWSYEGMGVNRKSGLSYLLGATPGINKDFVKVYIKDTAYAWVFINDCVTGRGFQLKLPYDKGQKFSIRSSGINNMDSKFNIADNLVVNTDRGNIYVEDMLTGKKAMMTFGEKMDIDYDAIHEYIDTVSVTSSKIWVKVKLAEGWKELTKDIVLE